MIKNEVGRGAIYLYIQLISSMISGYIFLILLARITTTEIIGTFSLVVSISEIFANIAIIGMPDVIQRFLGKSFLQNKVADAKVFVKISLIFLSVSIITSCAVILFLRDWLSDVFGIGFNLIIVVVLLVASYAVYSLLYSIVIAFLKTKLLALIIIISSVAKVTLATSLVLMGTGVLGLSLGYTFFAQVLSSILLGVVITKTLKSSGDFKKPEVSSRVASKNLLKGGVVVWIPVLIATIGIDLGTLVLYNIYGSSQSGMYFVTLAILNAINAVMYAIYAISLPILSSMTDGRKRFAWQTIRLSSIVVLPLSSSIIFYSKNIMQLIGSNYIEGSLPLQILLVSSLPIIVLTGISTLVFSYGQYRYTLLIELALNIPRTVLYFTLVPIFGMTGVAMSYTIGTAIGFIISTVIAKRIALIIFWKSLALTLVIPISIAFVFSTLNVNYIVGIVATITISYLLLMKLHVVAKSDISYLIALLPDQISKVLIMILCRLKKIISRFYR